jgi:hypothetical protein
VITLPPNTDEWVAIRDRLRRAAHQHRPGNGNVLPIPKPE